MAARAGEVNNISITYLNDGFTVEDYKNSDFGEDDHCATTVLCTTIDRFVAQILILAEKNKLNDIVEIAMRGEKREIDSKPEIVANLRLSKIDNKSAATFNIDNEAINQKYLDLINNIQQLIHKNI